MQNMLKMEGGAIPAGSFTVSSSGVSSFSSSSSSFSSSSSSSGFSSSASGSSSSGAASSSSSAMGLGSMSLEQTMKVQGTAQQLLGKIKASDNYTSLEVVGSLRELSTSLTQCSTLGGRVQLVNSLTAQGWAGVLMKVLSGLDAEGLEFVGGSTLRLVLHASQLSADFREALGRAGGVQILLGNLSAVKDSIDDETAFAQLLISRLAIMSLWHVATERQNRALLRTEEARASLGALLALKNAHMRVGATLTACLALSENTADEHAVKSGHLASTVSWLRAALNTVLLEYEGHSLLEILTTLAHLARLNACATPLLEAGAVPLAVQVLRRGREEERRAATTLVWHLAFHPGLRNAMRNDEELARELSVLLRGGSPWLAGAARGIGLLLLTEKSPRYVLSREGTQPGGAGPGALWVAESGQEVRLGKAWTEWETFPHVFPVYAAREGGVVISHDGVHVATATALRDKLQTRGVRVWMNTEPLSPHSLDQTLAAIEAAGVVFVTATNAYQDNPRCRTEYSFARMFGKAVVPLQVELGSPVDGWLSALRDWKLLDGAPTPSLVDGEGHPMTAPTTGAGFVINSPANIQASLAAIEHAVDRYRTVYVQNARAASDWAPFNPVGVPYGALAQGPWGPAPSLAELGVSGPYNVGPYSGEPHAGGPYAGGPVAYAGGRMWSRKCDCRWVPLEGGASSWWGKQPEGCQCH
uniref:Uncharacterized protein LOC116944694 isoform X1 n=1 Tax=Petromyzon marinus TaxID=7757 RepID=A0AAJ7TBH4_PETMA|nr:uncharacterized protein LOC116944694 isoform X1 [Petromyzon marinus]